MTPATWIVIGAAVFVGLCTTATLIMMLMVAVSARDTRATARLSAQAAGRAQIASKAASMTAIELAGKLRSRS